MTSDIDDPLGNLLLGDHEMTICLDSIASIRDAARRIAIKYETVCRAYEATDLIALPEKLPDASFGYIALSVSGFLDLMIELEACLSDDPAYHLDDGYRPISFLDAGCGTGRNLHLLASSGMFDKIDATGIDIVSSYIDFGRRVYRLGDRIQTGDCLMYDYGNFDAVYFFRPFVDDSTQRDFELRLVNGLPAGAYILAPLSINLENDTRLQPCGDGGQIWKKLG